MITPNRRKFAPSSLREMVNLQGNSTPPTSPLDLSLYLSVRQTDLRTDRPSLQLERFFRPWQPSVFRHAFILCYATVTAWRKGARRLSCSCLPSFTPRDEAKKQKMRASNSIQQQPQIRVSLAYGDWNSFLWHSGPRQPVEEQQNDVYSVPA